MASKEETRLRAATTIRELGGARALAGRVKIVTAANVAMSAGGCAYAIDAGQVAPAAGFALAAVVSVLMLRGGCRMSGKRERTYTRAEWIAEGRRLFGNDFTAWRFKCPRCKNIATGAEFRDVGARPDDMAKCCIGRFVKGRGCDWAAYGLLDICNVHVDGQPVFEFAPCDVKGGAA